MTLLMIWVSPPQQITWKKVDGGDIKRLLNEPQKGARQDLCIPLGYEIATPGRHKRQHIILSCRLQQFRVTSNPQNHETYRQDPMQLLMQRRSLQKSSPGSCRPRSASAEPQRSSSRAHAALARDWGHTGTGSLRLISSGNASLDMLVKTHSGKDTTHWYVALQHVLQKKCSHGLQNLSPKLLLPSSVHGSAFAACPPAEREARNCGGE